MTPRTSSLSYVKHSTTKIRLPIVSLSSGLAAEFV